jgi:hypothetical protein
MRRRSDNACAGDRLRALDGGRPRCPLDDVRAPVVGQRCWRPSRLPRGGRRRRSAPGGGAGHGCSHGRGRRTGLESEALLVAGAAVGEEGDQLGLDPLRRVTRRPLAGAGQPQHRTGHPGQLAALYPGAQQGQLLDPVGASRAARAAIAAPGDRPAMAARPMRQASKNPSSQPRSPATVGVVPPRGLPPHPGRSGRPGGRAGSGPATPAPRRPGPSRAPGRGAGARLVAADGRTGHHDRRLVVAHGAGAVPHGAASPEADTRGATCHRGRRSHPYDPW